MKTIRALLIAVLCAAALNLLADGQPRPEKEFDIVQNTNATATITIKVNAATKWTLLSSVNVTGPYNEIVTSGVGGKERTVVVPTTEPKRFYILSLEPKN